MKAYRRLPLDEGQIMPAHRSWFPTPPTYYRDVEFQLVYFRTDPAVVREHLPEPLEPDSDGLAVAFGIKVPFCSAYGPFNEAGISVRCTFRGQTAFFNTHLYLDNPAAICAGREIWGAPKEYAQVTFTTRGNLVYCQTVKDGVPIMTITSDITQKAEPAEVIPMFPSYRLKLIPKADAPGPAIKQIVNASPADMELKLLMKGNGMITFGSSANSDLAALTPREIVAAFYEVATYTEVWGEIVYDYLKKP
jgi:acetoacetate decarboxylase